jgi:hypothetical protein
MSKTNNEVKVGHFDHLENFEECDFEVVREVFGGCGRVSSIIDSTRGGSGCIAYNSCAKGAYSHCNPT